MFMALLLEVVQRREGAEASAAPILTVVTAAHERSAEVCNAGICDVFPAGATCLLIHGGNNLAMGVFQGSTTPQAQR